MKVVVLISGRGSNLTALINDQQAYSIEHVISNNQNAQGLTTASSNGINNSYINWKNKESAEKICAQVIQRMDPDLIILAGFMKILSAPFIDLFANKIINIHPSLLPLYQGLNTHQRAIEDGRKTHGASVHIVNKLLDSGPIIAQTTIDVNKNDTPETLAKKLLPKEHKLLTHVVCLIGQKKLKWTKDGVYLMEKPLHKPIQV